MVKALLTHKVLMSLSECKLLTHTLIFGYADVAV